MKKAREFCKLFMWAVIGGFTGRALHVYFFYKKNPGLLELMSAPWYAELIVPLIITIAIVVVLVVIRLILKKKDKE